MSISPTWFSFYDDDDDCADLFNIIEGIVSRKPDFIKDNLKQINVNQLVDEIMENHESNSSFFVNNPVENDLFEKTFNELVQVETGESTEEYELDEIDEILGRNDNQTEDFGGIDDNNLEEDVDFHEYEEEAAKSKCSEKEELYDSFLGCDIDVPLIERLKKKL